MAFQYLTNIPLDRARTEYRAHLSQQGFTSSSEIIPVGTACGRITAEAIYARICAPHYPASAMDGIALRAELTFGAGETTPVTLEPHQFIVVDTGDPIPDGCDAVVMIEDVVRLPEGRVMLLSSAAPWQHVRQIGEDICAGEMILPAHTAVTPAAIGSMLAAGVMEIPVVRKMTFAIIPTGDEVVPPTADPAPGAVIEFNSSIFSAMLEQWGARARVYPIVPDREELIEAAVRQALEECDAVILGAGSSAGREDYSARIIEKLGTVLFHGIAIKPGKPAILGSCGSKPVLGIPGYPVSGIIVLEQLVRPIVEDWYRVCPETAQYAEATLGRSILSGLKYQEFIRVRLGRVGDKLMATPLSRGSGIVSSFMKADGILEVPQGVEGYEAGQTVSVRLLRPLHHLDNTLVSIGSHDPLLDEVADLLHQADRTIFMSSSHVGSMGGIMAVRRGETHIAGTHLLHEADGTYNTAFVKRYFPDGGVRLVECVNRVQGLMLQKGNPLGIGGISDLTRKGLRYVNRQKGSGTRILIDYLCKKEGISPDGIYGYDREEFTHTSVAAQIANGTADAGMGIYSAARLYDLDFLPICNEQYDLLISDEAWSTPMVQQLLQILRGDEFRHRLDSLGGYIIDRPGRVREHF